MITHAKAVNRCRRVSSPPFLGFSLCCSLLLRGPVQSPSRCPGAAHRYFQPLYERKAPKMRRFQGHRRAAPSEAAGGLVVAAQVLERPGTRGRARRAGGGQSSAAQALFDGRRAKNFARAAFAESRGRRGPLADVAGADEAPRRVPPVIQ